MIIRLITIGNAQILGISTDPDNIYLLQKPHQYSPISANKYIKFAEPDHVGTGIKDYNGAIDFYKNRVSSSHDITGSAVANDFLRFLNENSN